MNALNPDSPIMLQGDWVPENTHEIDFDNLPRVPSRHTIVSDVHPEGREPGRDTLHKDAGGVNQHNYLAFHRGRYWAMWSDGPGIEDRVGQRVSFATSEDGLNWTAPEFLTPPPPGAEEGSPLYGVRTDQGLRYISRGFWQREGELLALAALDEAGRFFGPSLELHAFRLNPDEATWDDLGVVHPDAINNFPPMKLPSGEWMMSRRCHDYGDSGISFLVGGVREIDQWESFPVLGSNEELFAEEPLWWTLPGDTLMALFRDNRHSGFLYRSFSTDNGRNWSKPIQTNFPDATSKLHGRRLSDGRYVLVSNANPRKRDPLTLSLSDNGTVFHTMGYLVGGRWIDYPHLIEHEGHLLIAFAGGKQSIEVLKVRIADLDGLKN